MVFVRVLGVEIRSMLRVFYRSLFFELVVPLNPLENSSFLEGDFSTFSFQTLSGHKNETIVESSN